MSDDIDLDPDALKRLRDLGGDDLLGKMIKLFLDSVPARLDAVHSGVAAGDAPTIEIAAHSLKSSAGNLGTIKLQRSARDIEMKAHGGESTALAADAAELTAAFETASALLRAELARIPTNAP